jgi:hypothetical protein
MNLTHINRALTESERQQATAIRAAAQKDFPPKELTPMPLYDHFHRPLSTIRHWQGFHSSWAAEIVRGLDEILPDRYFAEPKIKIGPNVEVDVGTFEEAASVPDSAVAVATKVWAPPHPPLTAPLDFADLETFEVQVLRDEEGPTLVAAIELVSPGNKDRPATRAALTSKCASYLQDGVSVVLVDIVTSRTANLFNDLLDELRLGDLRAWPEPAALYAASCRSVFADDKCHFEAWPFALSLGSDLPTVPLWLGADLVLPVDLQASYEATCSVLRIR